MVGFPKVIKTKADLVNTYKLVKKGRLKKEDWLAAVEKLEIRISSFALSWRKPRTERALPLCL